MNDNSARQYVRQFLVLMHPQLIDFAEQSFSVQGRGVVRVEIPPIPRSAVPEPFISAMAYGTEDDLKRPKSTDDAATATRIEVLRRLVGRYEPPRQAVVVFELPDAEPIVGIMDLSTMMIDEGG